MSVKAKATVSWRVLKQAMRRLVKRLHNPAKHTLKGARQARKFLGKWVDSGGQGKWPKLRSETLTHREKKKGYYRRRGSGKSPLRWAGGIRASLAKKNAPGHIERVSNKNTIIFGSNYTITETKKKGKSRKVEVVRIHHWGRGRNPKRTLIPVDKIKRFFVAEARAMAQLQGGFTRFK